AGAGAQPPQVPRGPGLAQAQGVGQVLHRGLRRTRQVLEYAQARDAGERLEMGSELAQRGWRCQRRAVHITKALWIIAGAITWSGGTRRRAKVNGSGGSAGRGALLRERALGPVAAVVDAFQPFGDGVLKLADPLL